MDSMTGTIKRITDRGFGFIAAPDGVEYFFHQSLLRKACSAEFLPEAAGRARVSGRDAAFAG